MTVEYLAREPIPCPSFRAGSVFGLELVVAGNSGTGVPGDSVAAGISAVDHHPADIHDLPPGITFGTLLPLEVLVGVDIDTIPPECLHTTEDLDRAALRSPEPKRGHNLAPGTRLGKTWVLADTAAKYAVAI